MLAPADIERLRKVLSPYHPKHRMTPQKLSFITEPRSIESINNLYLETEYGVLDVDSKELARLHSGKSLNREQWQSLAELAVLGHFQMDRKSWSRPAWVESEPPTFRFHRRDGRILNIIFHESDSRSK